ncbi:hypothetical protein ABZX75_27535 [Streptomyces sp. NPDC003038]|uniref:hypothetical protein n=1 Tax=unclassified Streptomyces TaxID=2593676 RepID=UPI0033B2C5D4
MKIAFWDRECPFMWHKERLVNLAVQRLPTHYTHVVWLDNDVIVGPGWRDAVREAFKKAPLIQAFRAAHHQRADGYAFSQPSALLPGENGVMGLAWGACRSLFTDGPGLFELALVGGGDTALGIPAMARTAGYNSVPWLYERPAWPARVWPRQLLKPYETWRSDITRWIGDADP